VSRYWYEFGPYRLEPATRSLFRDGQIIKLTPKAVDTLRVLVQHSGEVVTKEKILSEVWPGTFVEEGSLTRNISDLRRILDGLGTSSIETVPRRGYRLTASVQRCEEFSKEKVRTVAVLCFEALDDLADSNLPERLADALVVNITKLKELRVLSARELGDERTPGATRSHFTHSDFILEGTLQMCGPILRVTTRMTMPSSGSVVWAERFEEQTNDMFLLEESIAEQIAGAVGLLLSTEQPRLLSRRCTESAEAYRLYLRGRFHWGQRSPREMERAIQLFRKALLADSKYWPAHSALSCSYALLPMLSAARPHEFMPKAKASAIAALEIDESLAEARSALALVKWHYEWNWKGAEQEFRRIINAYPAYSVTHQWYALLLVETGRYSEAISEAAIARELDPSPSIRANQAMVMCLAGRYQEAIDIACDTLRAFPGSFRARIALSLAMQAMGRVQDAIRELEEAYGLSQQIPLLCGALGYLYAATGRTSDAQTILRRLINLPPRQGDFGSQALIHAGMGDLERALDSLERAYEEREFHLVLLKVDWRFECLRAHPRFKLLLEHIGLD
jgi:DNA-binding winged helix-turn-helix (wHTH) protein/tetratricopeptide (TPR) repeat protein